MATITSKVGSVGKITFTVALQSGDPLEWGIYISSKTDFRLGMSGMGGDYPYYVTEIHDSGSKSIDTILTPAQYAAELALRGVGVVDYTLFDIKATPANPTIYNACWSTGGGACGEPAVTAGKTVDIRADIANTGPAGEVMVGFKINGVNKYAENNLNLPTFSDTNPQIWTVYYRGFVMPPSDVKLEIVALYLNSSGSWTQTDLQSFTISTNIPGCTGLTLSPYSSVVNNLGDKVTLTASATPENVQFTVSIKDKDSGAVYGTCKTTGTGTVGSGSGNTCSFSWDSSGKTVGQNYNIIATADSCISAVSVIQILPPISQANLTILVLDKDTNNPISGASVLVNLTGTASQSKTTDSNGYAVFKVDFGTINIAISKDKYNTVNDVKSVFSDTSLTEYLPLIPIIPTVGDIDFVSVPVAEVFIDGKDTGYQTPIKVMGISAGSHKWTLKQSGYNDSNGTVTVQSGGLSEVYATLSVLTPTAGSLNITSTPLGAEVIIDGQDYNVTTSGMTTIDNITPGNHTLRLTMSGYKDLDTTFTITAGQTTYLNKELIPLVNIGSLEISSDPSGARIYIDGVDTKYSTPATITNLKEGDHKYKVVLSGYKDVSGTFTIIAGQTTIVHLVLEKSEGLGTAATIIGAIAAGVAILGFMQKKEKVE